MQTMKLADDLFEKIEDHSKGVTIRSGWRNVDAGPLTFEAVNGTVKDVTVNVNGLSWLRFREITDELAWRDGCENAQELKDLMRRFYPDMHDDSPITVIHFTY